MSGLADRKTGLHWPALGNRAWAAPRAHTWGAVLALLLALPALWPLLQAGFFVSDDGRFHVYRIAALAEAWQQGVLHPRLFPEFGFGYGQAVLNFYAPLSYWPGALLATLGVDPAAAAELTIALGFLLAALAAYGFANYLWGPAGGVLAAVAYTYFPYHLADAYLRGAIPEHFAFIWPPLILWAYTAAFREEHAGPPLLWSALAWAGLVLTHNLTALLMAPVAAAYLLLLAWRSRRRSRLWPAPGSLVLALALSAALWLPFLAESRAVGLGSGPSDGYQDHLAPLTQAVSWAPLYRYRVQPGGTADHPLSWTALVLFVLGLGLLARRPRHAFILGFGLALAAVSSFMTTSLSLPIWRPLAPVLGHLQYPWRFLTLTAMGMMLAAGGLARVLGGWTSHRCAASPVYDLRQPPAPLPAARSLDPADPRIAGDLAALDLQGEGRQRFLSHLRVGGGRGVRFLLPVLLLVIMIVPLPYLHAQTLSLPASEAYAPDRMWREDAEAGQVGATWTGEFLPVTVQEQRWALGRPREGAQDGRAPAARPQVQLLHRGYTIFEFQITTAAPLSLRLHQFYLPGWNVWIDGVRGEVYATDELGLVTADVPAGTHRVTFRFGPTTARAAGALLALAGAAIWAALALYWRRFGRGLAAAAAVLLVLAGALGLNGLGVAQSTWTPAPAEAAVEDMALLLGYDLTPARGDPDALDVTLYWLALRQTGTDYKSFVHLVGQDGQVITQHDGDPGGGYTPTTRWRAGELIPDRHRLSLPDTMADGEYRLKTGLYQYEPPRNLSVEPLTADGRIDLGSIQFGPR